MAKTLYQLLNIQESATDQQIHRAFKDIERHYSKRNDNSALDSLNRAREAFLILTDTTRRIAYDRKLASGRLPTSQAAMSEPMLANPWLQKIALVAILLLPLVGWMFYSNEQNKQQAEAARLHSAELITAATAIKNQQDLLLRQTQQAQADQESTLENRQIDAELDLRQQQLENAKLLAEQQLQNQAQSLDLLEKRLNNDARAQEQYIAERQLELQYKKPAMSMALQAQQDQLIASQRQRALQQHDQNIDSINSLRAARLKAYDREHNSAGISTSNPALDP